MTDKEQIMINDVDVSECIHLYSRWPGSIPPDSCACWEEPNDLTDTPVTDCKRHENCYFKQLARKTQECKELENKIKKLRKNLALEIEINDRYRKALEEIEKVINNILNSCLGRNTVSCRPAHNVCGDLINILNIISKAKNCE